MRTVLYLGAAAVSALASLVLLSGRGASVRPLAGAEAASSGGEMQICALKVINLTTTCKDREVAKFGDPSLYKCDGNDLDQSCQAATTNTNNVCGKSTATCSGNQWKQPPGGQWVPDGTCSYPWYDTAYLKQGQCNPAP